MMCRSTARCVPQTNGPLSFLLEAFKHVISTMSLSTGPGGDQARAVQNRTGESGGGV